MKNIFFLIVCSLFIAFPEKKATGDHNTNEVLHAKQVQYIYNRAVDILLRKLPNSLDFDAFTDINVHVLNIEAEHYLSPKMDYHIGISQGLDGELWGKSLIPFLAKTDLDPLPESKAFFEPSSFINSKAIRSTVKNLDEEDLDLKEFMRIQFSQLFKQRDRIYLSVSFMYRPTRLDATHIWKGSMILEVELCKDQLLLFRRMILPRLMIHHSPDNHSSRVVSHESDTMTLNQPLRRDSSFMVKEKYIEVPLGDRVCDWK